MSFDSSIYQPSFYYYNTINPNFNNLGWPDFNNYFPGTFNNFYQPNFNFNAGAFTPSFNTFSQPFCMAAPAFNTFSPTFNSGFTNFSSTFTPSAPSPKPTAQAAQAPTTSPAAEAEKKTPVWKKVLKWVGITAAVAAVLCIADYVFCKGRHVKAIGQFFKNKFGGGRTTNPGGTGSNPGGGTTNPGGTGSIPGGGTTNPGGSGSNPGGSGSGSSGIGNGTSGGSSGFRYYTGTRINGTVFSRTGREYTTGANSYTQEMIDDIEEFSNIFSSRQNTLNSQQKEKLAELFSTSEAELENLMSGNDLDSAKKLYRKLAKQFHPDTAQGDTIREMMFNILNNLKSSSLK